MIALLLGAPMAPVLAVGYQPAPGTNPVDFVRYEWHDLARNRELPVKIYFPKAGMGPCPVILFSPGLGSSREAYGYLGEAWAAQGYVTVHLQHPGSDGSVFKNGDSEHAGVAMRAVLKEPQHILDRAQDISFAMDELAWLNRQNSLLQHRLDMSRVGLAGHSYGAAAILIVMGERVPEVGEKYRDDRFRAAIAISPPIFRGLGFDDIRVPVLVMTGTQDAGFTRTWLRQTAYDKIESPGTCLVNFKGAEHFTFGDPLRPSDNTKVEKIHPLILAATTAFWDARLRDDPGAKSSLEQGGFNAWMKHAGKFEVKR
jgi:predicted dienelactone hydrolase